MSDARLLLPDVRLRLLGPVEMWVGRRSVPLGPARQRTVLAALAVDAGRPVPVDVLIGRVWDEQPPDQVRATLYSYVTRLRRVLDSDGDGPATLRRPAGGYVLDIDPDSVDLLQFQGLVRSAGSDVDLIERALGLWRGPALADLSGAWVEQTRDLIEQQRVDAVLEWARVHLAAGRPAAVIDPLRPLVALHPFVEPLAALLIGALHQSGRAAEALDCYARVRQRLVEELGTEPGPELRELHRTVLHGDGPRMSARSTLPADTGGFTGRAAEIARITDALAGGREQVLDICAIAGMPGVGKTALAVHVAHRLRDRFPDGQVFVDLHGHTANRAPAAAVDVLASLLTADGVDPRQLPADVEARSALWRERLAGRRVLLVLDNAVDSAQVSPMLPGSAGCLVLVTSRRFLGDLPADAISVPLDVMSATDAERIFRRLAPRDVALTKPVGDAVGDLVAACGYLPLAVSLLARMLRRHRRWTVADLLHETRSRLLDVSAEHASVAAAFELSYRHLPAARQRFFRLLAAHPGTEFEPYAAAALAGVGLTEATDELNALHADSLLIEVGYRRYTMHDLIRMYAAVLSTQDSEPAAQATERLLDFYQGAGAAASDRLSRLVRPRLRASARKNRRHEPPVPAFHDGDRALAWLRTERANVLACVATTLEGARDRRRTVELAAGLAELLRRDGPWAEALALNASAVRAAADLGDDLAHANALTDRATLHRLSGDFPAAARDAGSALELYVAAGSRRGEAFALVELGKALSRAADYLRSAGVVQRALDLYRDLGDGPGEAAALVELAVARGMMSDFEGAQGLLRQALGHYRRLGDRPGEAYALRILGIAHGRVGDYAGALPLLTMALDLYRGLGSRIGQALTHNDLGRVAAGFGDYGEAARALRSALRQHRENDHRIGESMALLYLGGALRRTGDLVGAASALEEALTLDRRIHNRSGEAMALNEIGAVRRLSGDVDGAVSAHQEALDVASLVPSPWDEAQSLAGFGRCALARGDAVSAARQLRAALTILRRINAAETAEVEAELLDLGGAS